MSFQLSQGKYNIPFLLVLISYLLILIQCKNKDENEYLIPDVYVNMQINLDLPLYSSLQNPGTYIYIHDEGYKGLIIYHDNSGYIALERTCPYRPLDECSKVTVDNSGIMIRCGQYKGTNWEPCCNSKFEMNGNVLEGPSIYPLKKYNVTRDGNMLTIRN